jgi:hypothetical protein
MPNRSLGRNTAICLTTSNQPDSLGLQNGSIMSAEEFDRYPSGFSYLIRNHKIMNLDNTQARITIPLNNSDPNLQSVAEFYRHSPSILDYLTLKGLFPGIDNSSNNEIKSAKKIYATKMKSLANEWFYYRQSIPIYLE